jgi:hypothetical protein
MPRSPGIGNASSRPYALGCSESEHDMTRLVKVAGLAGMLVATVTAELKAAQLNNAVREGHAVVTELSANASAIT